MKYVVTINKKRYEVEVEKGEASVLSTTIVEEVKGQVVAPTPVAAAPVAAPAAKAPAPAGGGDAILAPMPGVIVGAKVAVGATVKKGQIVLILEAMKMENEIFAPKDGVITSIAVTKGASVNTGDVLFTVQ